jgi:hypothetical protein
MQIFYRITGARAEKRGLVTPLCTILLCVLLSLFAHRDVLAQHQAAFESTGLNKPATDVTRSGTVQQVVEQAPAGVPRGIQIGVEGPQGTFTAVLAPKLNTAMRQSLAAGAPVTASGVFETINANSYLIVRKLTVSGIPFTIRNEYGFTVHPQERPRASAVDGTSGGAR